MKDKIAFLLVLTFLWNIVHAQVLEKRIPEKVSHAEPIYFDLIRDLGARKGERELNVGMGVENHRTHSEYIYLVEYEFAPVNRLGLELELPIAFVHRAQIDSDTRAQNGIQAMKAAIQYSFFVSEKIGTTMAAGYIFERELSNQGNQRSHNPFFIIAKRWGKQFHTMLYAGSITTFDGEQGADTKPMINASVHYVLPGSRNFVGIEVNEEGKRSQLQFTVRPQIKMTLSPSSSIGLSLGMVSNNKQQPFDFLIRWIYELRKKN